MKINGYGIPPQSQSSNGSAGSSRSNDTKRVTESPVTTPATPTVNVVAQGAHSQSAVRLPGNGYGAKLNEAEQKALDAIFARYREIPSLSSRLETESDRPGQIIDVTV